MAQVAVTYTWVVEVDDPNDKHAVADAAEGYVHSVSWAFTEPASVEVLTS